MIYTCQYPSALGQILLAEQDGALIGLWLEGQKTALSAPEKGCTEKQTPTLALAKAWLDRYFAGERPSCSELPLAPQGSPFRQLIWQLLCEIPYGETVTYGFLAKQAAARMGKARMSAQAVGGAVGSNPISIIIPCHRVIGADGSLTGYAGGLALKEKLLSLEANP